MKYNNENITNKYYSKSKFDMFCGYIDIDIVEHTTLDIILNVRIYLHAMKNIRNMNLYINDYEYKAKSIVELNQYCMQFTIYNKHKKDINNNEISYVRLLKKYSLELQHRTKEIPIFIKSFGDYNTYNDIQKKFIERTLNIHNILSEAIKLRNSNISLNTNTYKQIKDLILSLGESINKKTIHKEVSNIAIQSFTDIMNAGVRKTLGLFW